ncbi:MAG TPA: GtrA family protein [Streptosporangiaceae bacterium]
MTFARNLIEQVRHLWHEVAKFGVVGAVGFVVTEVGFNLMHFDAGLGLFTSNALATAVAAIVTFAGNKYWTFRHRAGHGTRRETIIFILLNGVGALIQYACVWTAKNGFDTTDKYLLNVAFLIGIGLGTLFRFWSYRKWVWNKLADEPPAEPSTRSDLVGRR